MIAVPRFSKPISRFPDCLPGGLKFIPAIALNIEKQRPYAGPLFYRFRSISSTTNLGGL